MDWLATVAADAGGVAGGAPGRAFVAADALAEQVGWRGDDAAAIVRRTVARGEALGSDAR